MTWLWIILGFLILVIISAFIPEPTYRCDMCHDSGFIETNIWYDEVITVDCPKCKEQSERTKKILKIKRLLRK